MALTKGGSKALSQYFERTQASDKVEKFTIKAAVELTPKQQTDIQAILGVLWALASCACPLVLDLKPHHGYASRVIKDCFSAAQYGRWLELGCSDSATVGQDANGRPRLVYAAMIDYPGYRYNIMVPIRSDARGAVHIDDVIPAGLPAGALKTR